MQKKIIRERELTERGIKIMLMTPEELEQFKVNEWLEKVRQKNPKKIYDSIEDHEKKRNLR